MKSGTSVFFAMFLFLLPLSVKASGYNISGKIIKPDGTPFTGSSVSFIVAITNSAGTCTLFREQHNAVDMNSSNKGAFHLLIGSGNKLYPTDATALEKIFSNKTNLNCEGGSTFTPAVGDERAVKVSFYDGTDWQQFAAQSLKAVPFSTEAQNAQTADKLGLFGPESLLRIDSGNLNPLTQAEGTNLVELAKGTSASYLKNETDPSVKNFAKTDLPICTTGSVLKSDGTTLTCVPTLTTNPLPTGTTGKFLRHDGTDWKAASIDIADVTNLTTQLSDKLSVSKLPASCSASQTLNYTSVTDTWNCVNIVLANSGVTSGSYGSGVQSVNLTVNSAGLVTSISNQPISFPVTSVAGKTGIVALDVGDIQSGSTKYFTYRPNDVACADGGILKWNNANSRWECGVDGNSGGTITSITSANSYITINNPSSPNPQIQLNFGTGANQVALGNDPRIANAIQVGAGDFTGTILNPTVGKIQGKIIDVSAGYQDGDTLVYDNANSKWILKHSAGCDTTNGWNKVSKGTGFCIKKIDTTTRTWPVSFIACENAGAELCSTNELIHACRDTNKLANGEASWSSFISGGNNNAVKVTCTSTGGAYDVIQEDMGGAYMTYCCRPLGR